MQVFLRFKLRFPSLSIAALGLAFTVPTQASEPAYDCAKATGGVEKLICSDDSLAALDRKLADVYRTALQTLPQDEVSLAKAEQRGWIKGRNECWKSEDINACVTNEYQSRIVALQIKSGQLSAPTAVSYDCGEREQTPVTAAFYGDTSPPAVVLTVGQDQVIAFTAASGSGARYTTDRVEFWEHQGEATVTWFGTQMKCSVLK